MQFNQDICLIYRLNVSMFHDCVQWRTLSHLSQPDLSRAGGSRRHNTLCLVPSLVIISDLGHQTAFTHLPKTFACVCVCENGTISPTAV